MLLSEAANSSNLRRIKVVWCSCTTMVRCKAVQERGSSGMLCWCPAGMGHLLAFILIVLCSTLQELVVDLVCPVLVVCYWLAQLAVGLCCQQQQHA